MEILIILLLIIFVVGYGMIIGEHSIHVDKSSSALLVGSMCWAVVAFIVPDPHIAFESLKDHISEIAFILFFLMGAMTIVELIDLYDGFDIITDRITTRSQTKLLWIICIITFFLSAVLDNLTTTIVMVTLVRKLIPDKSLKLMFVGLIVVAANAGGAWSPMGDVTTTMLWIGGQVSGPNIVMQLFLPSLACMVIPVLVIAPQLRGTLPAINLTKNAHDHISDRQKKIVFFVGLGGLLFVPVFKTVTHLPPFVGMLFSLGVLWFVTERFIKTIKDKDTKKKYSVHGALEKVDMPSVLFFLGILLAVSALQTVGILTTAATWLTNTIGNQTVVVTLIGLLSSIVDNVPLVAASMGMYSLEQFPMDNPFWELLAYCAGTGGSALIIGSAAGVAAMGMEKIEFFWYLKKISWLALIGYFVGIGVFFLQQNLFH